MSGGIFRPYFLQILANSDFSRYRGRKVTEKAVGDTDTQEIVEYMVGAQIDPDPLAEVA